MTPLTHEILNMAYYGVLFSHTYFMLYIYLHLSTILNSFSNVNYTLYNDNIEVDSTTTHSIDLQTGLNTLGSQIGSQPTTYY